MSHARRLRRLLLAAVAACAAVVALAAPAAQASFGTHDLSLTLSTTQAGGHPDVTTSLLFNAHVDPTAGPTGVPGPVPDDSPRSVRLSLPAGLVGDPLAVPQCPAATFGAMDNYINNASCPDDTQVGVAWVTYTYAPNQPVAPVPIPVYNVAPGDDQAGRLGFQTLTVNNELAIGVRASDGGLETTIDGINQAARLYAQSLTLWGVPADSSHDTERGGCLTGMATPPCSVSTPRVPFMRNATSCPATPSIVSVSAESWENPGTWVTESEPTPAITGCASVPFHPSIAVTPETTSADAPTGLDVNLSVDQNRDPDGLAAGDVRRTVVTLPDGYTISPSAADGLQACDDARVGLGSAAAAQCPDASKVGSATITSPILGTPLSGPVYLGPSTAPDHYRVYAVVEGSGVRLKLPGDIVADPATGRLTTTFDDTPQQPFSSFKLHFDGGPRAVLASPATCGTATASAAVSPWSGNPASQLTAPVALGGGSCPSSPAFAPSLAAGLTDATAGAANTAFALTVARDDRTQGIGAISSVTLPPGLTARIGTVPRCDAARAEAGTCQPETRVGRVTVAAGPGSDPLRLSGTAYLTEGYRGAPYGLSLVVPAIAGPYDLGTVVIRSAIQVGPDARVTVKTDPLPQVVGGIPLRLRSVGLVLDRPGFMVAPTSCAQSAVEATIASTGGASTTLSSRFGMSGCSKLPFRPKMAVSATPSTSKAGAGLHVALTQPTGQANMKSVAVSLPKQISVKLKALGTVCNPQQLAALACPAAAKVGGASATTPLLSAPLKGAVYLVQAGKSLPQLVAILQGGGLTIPLVGTTTVVGSRLGTTFGAIPDVPISAFALDLPHNKRAILETTKWRCRSEAATVTFTAQNGAKLTRTVPVSSRCPKAKR